MFLLPSPKVVYRGTVTGLRISSVHGTAFVDNAGATIPTYADGNHQIEIYDASNRMLRGVLKAAGTSETVTELLDDTSFDDASKWTTLEDGWSVSGGQAIKVTSASGIKIGQTKNTVYHGLVKSVFTVSAISGGFIRSTIQGSVALATHTSAGTFTDYAFDEYGAPARNIILLTQNSATTTATVDSFSMSKVLTPSSSGCTIVSSKAGTTYNFSYKNASFVYNAASYYVIIKRLR